jgi:HD domain
MSSGCGGLPIWVYRSEVRGQPRMARRGAAIVLLALLAPQGTLLVLRTEPSLDLLVRSATVHLVVVSAISACALAVAMATAVAAGRSRDGSLVLLALGCLAVGFLMIVLAAVVLLAVGAVHWWRWRLGFDRVQLALVVACLLGAGALVSLQVGTLWRLSWWDYHAFLLTGFAAAIYAVLTGYRRSRTLEEVLDGVFAADPMVHISRGYSETLRALIGAVEARDAYTHGHSARVAELAVHLGQRLGLGPAALRSLAEGAYLHDVGKVGIPDHVLNEPGALSEEHPQGQPTPRPGRGGQRSTIQVVAAQASHPPGLLVDRFGVAVGRGGVGPGTPTTRVRRRAGGRIGRHGSGPRMPQQLGAARQFFPQGPVLALELGHLGGQVLFGPAQLSAADTAGSPQADRPERQHADHEPERGDPGQQLALAVAAERAVQHGDAAGSGVFQHKVAHQDATGDCQQEEQYGHDYLRRRNTDEVGCGEEWCRPGGRPTCDQPLPRTGMSRQLATNAAKPESLRWRRHRDDDSGGRVSTEVLTAPLCEPIDRRLVPAVDIGRGGFGSFRGRFSDQTVFEAQQDRRCHDDRDDGRR